MSRWRSSPSRRADGLRLAAALGVLLLLAPAAAAQAPPAGPDEATNLRVSKGPGTIRLAWDPPAVTPDGYQVRRCVLPSLRNRPVPYYGNCVGQGITATTWEEPVPAHAVFYLVSGRLAGAEGSIGRSFDGTSWTERVPVDCATPWPTGVVNVRVVLPDVTVVCGTDVIVTYPSGVTYVDASAACTDVTSGFLGVTNALVPGRIRHACVSATDGAGPGRITTMQFDRGDCPVPLSEFDVVQCLVIVGGADCGSTNAVEAPCTLE
jgi:hypothetical protein